MGAYFRAYAHGVQPKPEGPEACPTGTQFPVAFPYGYGQDMFDHMAGYMWAIVDKVRVPDVSGDFVLRWRWDTEQNPQIWTHCADVKIRALQFSDEEMAKFDNFTLSAPL